jgi:YD repeat-containing protein
VETRTTAGSPSPTTATYYTKLAPTDRLASRSGAETRTLTYDAHGRLTGYVCNGEVTKPMSITGSRPPCR